MSSGITGIGSAIMLVAGVGLLVQAGIAKLRARAPLTPAPVWLLALWAGVSAIGVIASFF